MDTLKQIFLYIWQLPQNLLGLLFLLFLRGEKRHELKGIKFYYQKRFPGGITLGEYIMLGSRNETTVRHEYGHVLQSRMLGPLYLFIIGLLSLLHAWLNGAIGCCKGHPEGYYHFYTEKWADKLGGAIRTH